VLSLQLATPASKATDSKRIATVLTIGSRSELAPSVQNILNLEDRLTVWEFFSIFALVAEIRLSTVIRSKNERVY